MFRRAKRKLDRITDDNKSSFESLKYMITNFNKIKFKDIPPMDLLVMIIVIIIAIVLIIKTIKA